MLCLDGREWQVLDLIGEDCLVDRLRAVLPAPRLIRYEEACIDTDVDPVELYEWSARVASATFEDIGYVEVVLRSAIAEQMCAKYGIDWYTRTDILDDPTLRLIERALISGRIDQLQTSPEVKHGKLVATLMFGFWVKILGKGSRYHGQRRIYDTVIWKEAVRGAFPAAGDFDRAIVERAVRDLKELRNRVAHHEHIIWGVPIPGQQLNGIPRRDTLAEAHANLIQVAQYLDPDFSSWLVTYSEVPKLIAACPVADTSRFLIN